MSKEPAIKCEECNHRCKMFYRACPFCGLLKIGQ